MQMPYRIDGPLEIDTAKLLFWPNNPRLKISDFSEVKFTAKDLLTPASQRRIFDLLSEHESHDVETLVGSMRKVGFLREKAPIVMAVGGTSKYLVLEGNRRLAAIRTIREAATRGMSTTNLKSLEKIPCWIFEHEDKDVPLQAAISRMVAEAHIKGQRAHTKLQRAHMLYDAYEGFLPKESKGRGFIVHDKALKETAVFFDFPENELLAEISVVRLYKQFVENYDFEDIPKKCSERLSWVHKNQRLFERYFGYDVKRLCFDEDGLERYYDIFLHPQAAVYNPRKFSLLLNVMRNGTPEDLEVIRNELDVLEEIEKRIRDQRSDVRFLRALQGIEKKLAGLRISDFNQTKEEEAAIRKIASIVESKLTRLIPEIGNHEDEREGQRSRKFKTPRDIEEALALDYSHIAKEVVRVVKQRPNNSCVRQRVPTLLLQAWGVRSRGRPRESFCAFVDQQVSQMIEDGFVHSYKAKNERIRV